MKGSSILTGVLLLFTVAIPISWLSQTSTKSARRRLPNRSRRVRVTQKTEAARLIRTVLDAQAAAWNRGDIEGYMNGYDRSPKTEFVGGDSITRGWQDVLDRYKKKYDSRQKMGTLTFSHVKITIVSQD